MTNPASSFADPCPAGQPLAKFDRGVSMLAWAYNEEALIEDFIKRLYALLESTAADFEIILVNDGSTDGTRQVVEAMLPNFPLLRLINNDSNRNIVYSFKKALAAATKEYLTWQTVDWAYDIGRIRLYLEFLRSFDVVLGVRPVPQTIIGGIPFLRRIHQIRSRSDNVIRAVQSLGYYYLNRLLFGTPFHDTQGIHFHKTALLQGLELKSESVFVGVEMLTRLHMQGATFLEVPIPFLPRQKGQAKGGRLGFILRTYGEVMRSWLDWGWRERQRYSDSHGRQVFRLTEPHFLEEEVIRLAAPLFKLFR